jgi:hypothetical protein
MKKIFFVIFFGQIILALETKKSEQTNTAISNINQPSNVSDPKTTQFKKTLGLNIEQTNLTSSKILKKSDSTKMSDSKEILESTNLKKTKSTNVKIEPSQDLIKANLDKSDSIENQKNEISQSLAPSTKDDSSNSATSNLKEFAIDESAIIKTEENLLSKNDSAICSNILISEHLNHHFRQIINGLKILKKINLKKLTKNEKQSLSEHLVDNLVSTLDLIKNELQKSESTSLKDFKEIKSMLQEKPFNLNNVKKIKQNIKKLISPSTTSNEIIHELAEFTNIDSEK